MLLKYMSVKIRLYFQNAGRCYVKERGTVEREKYMNEGSREKKCWREMEPVSPSFLPQCNSSLVFTVWFCSGIREKVRSHHFSRGDKPPPFPVHANILAERL